MDASTPGSNSENVNQPQQAAGQRQQRQQAHSSRRRNADPAFAAPTLAQLRSSRGPSGAGRSRVVQQEAPPAAGNSADGGSASKSLLRSRLPAAAPGGAQPPAAPAARAPGFSAQLFSVFTNPLSASGAAADAQHSSSRAAASIPAADSPVQAAEEPGDHHPAPQPQQPAAASAEARADAADATQQQAVSTSGSTHAADKDTAELQGAAATYCFEVQAASGSEEDEEHLINFNGHDQHATQQQQMLGPDGQLLQQQQLGGSIQLGGGIQQYVYDEDTGQLYRTGEGTQTTRLGRHYVEDCHTGEFFQLAQQPAGGLWAWLRRGPRLGADGWFRGAGVQEDLQQQHEPGFLHSLSDFLDTMASGMAALGLFAQGLAGGLALLCLFMTYIQYAIAGREAFLAFYSPQAEMVNRTFFTLISISLVAAAARHAYDQLGNFFPRHLRLGLVDSLVMLLYFLAYTCNLLATPLDDQLAFEAKRNPGFYTLPLPAAFESRLALWHGLNLARVVACGLAWVLVCYRSNHFVMLRVFEARRAEQEQQQQQQCNVPHGLHRQLGLTTGSQAATAGFAVSLESAADAAAAGRRLVRLGSNAALQGSFAADRGESMLWAVPSKRLGSGGAGVGSCPGSDQRR